ncbi:MAG TPA: hypothetical protein DCL70_02625 [Kocuria sp.]|nr:hypothetical protein [Kocuria sp.]
MRQPLVDGRDAEHHGPHHVLGPPGVEDPPPSSFSAPAPPLLTYADLKAAGEPRQLEAAQHVKDTHAHLWRP